MNQRSLRGESALDLAIEEGDFAMSKYLVDHGAEVNAAPGDHVTSPRAMMSHCHSGTGETPLHRASSTGNLQIAAYLIEHGADLQAKNAAGQSVLDVADKLHRNDSQSVFDYLLEHVHAEISLVPDTDTISIDGPCSDPESDDQDAL